jgi:hypothetical protein
VAKTKWWAIFDVQAAGSGYNAVAPKTKYKKGETLGTEEIAGMGGLWQQGPVFTGKIVQVEAEGEEEAILIASEAYGSRGGVGAVPHAEKELKFFAA